MRTLLLAAYGGVLGLVFILAMQGLDHRAFIEPGIVVGFMLAGAGSAVFAGRFARRVPSSLRLMGIAAVLGVGVAAASAARPISAEIALVLALVGAPLVALRLAIDLFVPRQSSLVRRLIVAVGLPALVFLLITAVHLSEGRTHRMTAKDTEFIMIMALLAPAIVPPRQLEEPEPDAADGSNAAAR